MQRATKKKTRHVSCFKVQLGNCFNQGSGNVSIPCIQLLTGFLANTKNCNTQRRRDLTHGCAFKNRKSSARRQCSRLYIRSAAGICELQTPETQKKFPNEQTASEWRNVPLLHGQQIIRLKSTLKRGQQQKNVDKRVLRAFKSIAVSWERDQQ